MTPSIAVSATAVYASYKANKHSGPREADISIELHAEAVDGSKTRRRWDAWRDRHPVNTPHVLRELVTRINLVHVQYLRLIYHFSEKRKVISFRDVVRYLKDTPTLEHLSVYGFSDPRGMGGMPLLWTALGSICRSTDGFLPHLRSLEITRCHIIRDAFVQFVEGRPKHLPSLRSLKVEDTTMDVLLEGATEEKAARQSTPEVEWKNVTAYEEDDSDAEKSVDSADTFDPQAYDPEEESEEFDEDEYDDYDVGGWGYYGQFISRQPPEFVNVAMHLAVVPRRGLLVILLLDVTVKRDARARHRSALLSSFAFIPCFGEISPVVDVLYSIASFNFTNDITMPAVRPNFRERRLS
ncbi:hypothetical protein EIP91_008118 [Steccherinum ochraceum]|uniref:Uncharacterized protein n=1 Tax=Steccherinum ochraceum TaxID=92696 RepID=A0A4R0R395_9APHY|nr:hypothetical protein EIP91_008118 [Steccherinum ochraceum]